ncbi:hypothetical protein C8R46DRAFT_1215316 [Mycena filopes]|nr:hypothetical protein C8R46DRAFT_1215316 [Mycena filopes]
MRPSTIFATLFATAVISAAPLDPVAPLPRADSGSVTHITSLASFRAAPRAAQKSFLLAIDPKTWILPPAALAQIAKQPKVAKRLNGAALTMQNMRD